MHTCAAAFVERSAFRCPLRIRHSRMHFALRVCQCGRRFSLPRLAVPTGEEIAATNVRPRRCLGASLAFSVSVARPAALAASAQINYYLYLLFANEQSGRKMQKENVEAEWIRQIQTVGVRVLDIKCHFVLFRLLRSAKPQSNVIRRRLLRACLVCVGNNFRVRSALAPPCLFSGASLPPRARSAERIRPQRVASFLRGTASVEGRAGRAFLCCGANNA